MNSATVTRLGDSFHISGFFNEETRLAPVVAEESERPIKLNFRALTGINSIGLRNFVLFCGEVGVDAVELYECPPMLVEVDEVSVGSHEVAMPIKRCHLCGQPLAARIDPTEYFVFRFG